jgi:hypothetical protein
MDIKRSGSQPSSKGPAEWFTGDVTRLLACTLHTCEYRDTHDSDLNGVDSPKVMILRIALAPQSCGCFTLYSFFAPRG